MAKQFNKEKYCAYELADASSFKKEVDGVVIHALLHHLSANELKKFFTQFAVKNRYKSFCLRAPLFCKAARKNIFNGQAAEYIC